MPRKKKRAPALLVGAAKAQSEIAEKTTDEVLYWIARFGWLTRHQIHQLIFENQNSELESLPHANRTLRILQRAKRNGLVADIPLPTSPGGQVLAWVLTSKGMKRAVLIHGSRIRYPKVYAKNRENKQYDIGDPKLHYHRFLGNQFLIDLYVGKIFTCYYKIKLWPEHELSHLSAEFNAHWGYIPDSLSVCYHRYETEEENEYGDYEYVYKDRVAILIGEIENSCRGKVRHGRKLTHWLEPYSSRLAVNAEFDGTFCKEDYHQVDMMFVSSEEGIFRNIYRKISAIFKEIRTRNIYHLVIPNKPQKRYWIDPLESADLLIHNNTEVIEDEYDQLSQEAMGLGRVLFIDTAQRVKDGENKKRTFKRKEE